MGKERMRKKDRERGRRVEGVKNGERKGERGRESVKRGTNVFFFVLSNKAGVSGLSAAQ